MTPYLAIVLIEEVYNPHEVLESHYMRLGKVLQIWKLFRLGAERTQEILGQPNGIDLSIRKLTACRYSSLPYLEVCFEQKIRHVVNPPLSRRL
jgi:hypothetical protein